MSSAFTGSTARGPFATSATVVLLFAAYISVLVVALPDTDLEKGHPLTFLLFEQGFSWLHRNLHLPDKLLVANSPDLETISVLENPNSHTAKSINAALNKVAGLDLRRRDLRHAELSLTKLYKADMRKAKVQGVSLESGFLKNVDLSLAELQGANFYGAKLQGAKFYGAELRDAILIYAQLQGADLGHAELQGAFLSGAELRGTDLSGARLQGADLSGARLQGADLSGAQLQGAILYSANLQGADLSGAQLQGANFNSAYIGSALITQVESGFNDFRNADYNKLFTQENYDAIPKILGNKRNNYWAEREVYMGLLYQRIGQATKLPQVGFEPPCLADANITAFKSCGKAEYFPQLVDFLGNLACKPGEAKSQRFTATVIAKRVVGISSRFLFSISSDKDFVEWENGGESARQKLAQRLLADDCAGNEGIDIDSKTREELKRIAEPPKPAPGAP